MGRDVHNYLVICVNYIVAYSLEILFLSSGLQTTLCMQNLIKLFVCSWVFKKISFCSLFEWAALNQSHIDLKE